MDDFKKRLQVGEEQLNKNNEIIRKLDELEKIYNSVEQNVANRTKVLRSGENVFFNMMLISGLLFKMNDTSNGIVDSTVIGRIKSFESIEKKENRKGRENKSNRDIIAYNIITERVHNSEDFFRTFKSIDIQGLYNERKSNLNIMNMAINFIKSFNMYEISSELDETVSVKKSKKRLDNMNMICDEISKNINEYNGEEKTLFKEFSTEEYLQIMCEDLLQQEIKRAKASLFEKCKNLQEKLKDEDKKDEEYIKIIKIQLTNAKLRVKLLSEKEDWNRKEIIDILYGEIDKERVELYTEILEHLKNKEIEDITASSKSCNEKKYCELLILILYQLTKLEFVKEGQYEGIIYNNVWMNLHNQLKEYRNCEIEQGSYSNITFESLQKLTTNLTRLNARLSDPLQYEIGKYTMKYHLKPIIEAFKEMEVPSGDEKLKSNGYVAVHYDLEDIEIKMTTHYREKVASQGAASYGNGRIDNKEEKSQDLRRLSYNKYLTEHLVRLVSRKENPIIKQAKVNKEIEKMIGKPIKIIEEFINPNLIDKNLNEWRENILRITPRYYSATYDESSDAIEIEFSSALRNVEKYYSQTSVIKIREEVKNEIEYIRKRGLLSDESYVIKISRNQYKEFLQYEMKDLRDKIELKLYSDVQEVDKNEKQGITQE